MNALLNTLVGMQRPPFGQYAENTAPMDLFVLATLATLFFLLGCFGTWAWLIYRRSNRPAPHLKLLMELNAADPSDPAQRKKKEKEPEKRQEPKQEEEDPAPWERPGDWWKE